MPMLFFTSDRRGQDRVEQDAYSPTLFVWKTPRRMREWRPSPTAPPMAKRGGGSISLAEAEGWED